MPLFKAKKTAPPANQAPADPNQWQQQQQYTQMQYDTYNQMAPPPQAYMQGMTMGPPAQMGYSYPQDQQQYYGAQAYPPGMSQQQAFQQPLPMGDQQSPSSKSKKASTSKASPTKAAPPQSIPKAISLPKQSQPAPPQAKPPSPVDSLAGGGNPTTEDLFESEDFDPGDETDSNIRVIIRVRPPNSLELKNGYTKILECDANHRSLWIASQDGRDRPLTFNRVYDQDVSQGRFFEESGIKDLIHKSLDGYRFFQSPILSSDIHVVLDTRPVCLRLDKQALESHLLSRVQKGS